MSSNKSDAKLFLNIRHINYSNMFLLGASSTVSVSQLFKVLVRGRKGTLEKKSEGCGAVIVTCKSVVFGGYGTSQVF